MKLREYLDDEIIEVLEFSRMLGVTEHTVHNWLNGVVPLRINQVMMKKVTNGKVDLIDWGTNERKKKKANGRVRGTKNNGMRDSKHLDVDKKTKPKGSSKKR